MYYVVPPDAAAELAALLNDAINRDEITQMQVLRNSIALWEAPRPGETDPASWQNTMDILIDTGLLPGPLDDLAAAYTNGFLP